MIWLLSWAVLVLIIIYSPVGSPELYRKDNYIVYNQGVNFGGSITNAPTVHNYQQSEDHGTELPTYTHTTKSYSINTSASTSSNTGKANYSVSARSGNSILSTQTTGGSSTGGGFVLVSSHSSAQSRPTLQTNGITTLNTDLNLMGNQTTTRQLATDGTTDGGTDPGGDPTGPPIPVGDGFCILLLMAAGYAFKLSGFKFRNTTKKSTIC